MEESPIRRRSPGYVRQWSSETLHAVLGRFNVQRQTMDLSEAQEWLYDAIVSELEYRRRHAPSFWDACSCWFCASSWSPESEQLPF